MNFDHHCCTMTMIISRIFLFLILTTHLDLSLETNPELQRHTGFADDSEQCEGCVDRKERNFAWGEWQWKCGQGKGVTDCSQREGETVYEEMEWESVHTRRDSSGSLGEGCDILFTRRWINNLPLSDCYTRVSCFIIHNTWKLLNY